MKILAKKIQYRTLTELRERLQAELYKSLSLDEEAAKRHQRLFAKLSSGTLFCTQGQILQMECENMKRHGTRPKSLHPIILFWYGCFWKKGLTAYIQELADYKAFCEHLIEHYIEIEKGR